MGVSEAKEDLRSRRDTIFANKFFTLVSAPEGAHDVDDDPNYVALCVIDFNEHTVTASTDEPPAIIKQIFNNTGESGKFRVFRNRLLFLLANKQGLVAAIDKAREYKAIKNIRSNPNRLDDLSESQQNQLKLKAGEMDLDVRIALTNAYRHLFYPASDPVKAAHGLMHYTLPAQDSGDVKGNGNQQDTILKALKDCQKIRSEDAAAYAPAYILQKVWLAGLDHWTTKSLKEAFAKDLNLNILLDAELSKLRDTIRQGLSFGQWDLKFGERLFIKTNDNQLVLPELIEFSERMQLYRRGILVPPVPKEIELSAQVLSGTTDGKVARIRWKALGALTVTLYSNGIQVSGDFRPSDEWEVEINQTTTFKAIADYGNGESAVKETKLAIVSSTSNGNGDGSSGGSTLFDFDPNPPSFELDGTPNSIFNDLSDRISDHKVKAITALEVSVGQVIDYRKLGTALPLLQRFPMQIDQTVTIQAGEQFVRLEYQGSIKGFQSFFTPTNALLNSPETQANVALKLVFEFTAPVQPQGNEIVEITKAFGRNPVERMNLIAKVNY